METCARAGVGMGGGGGGGVKHCCEEDRFNTRQ